MTQHCMLRWPTLHCVTKWELYINEHKMVVSTLNDCNGSSTLLCLTIPISFHCLTTGDQLKMKRSTFFFLVLIRILFGKEFFFFLGYSWSESHTGKMYRKWGGERWAHNFISYFSSRFEFFRQMHYVRQHCISLWGVPNTTDCWSPHSFA